MDEQIRLFVGYDAREALAYSVFCESVIHRASLPVSFTPIHQGMSRDFDLERDGSNAFMLARFLVPMLCGFQGWAIFCDGDMVVNADIKELYDYRLGYEDKAVCVVPHDYKTKAKLKYVGSSLESPNIDYPKKNQSSVILWNCAHPSNQDLTESYIAKQTPKYLHRFGWLNEDEIGELPTEWNYLVGEQPPSKAHLNHYTLGLPALKAYANDYGSWHWHSAFLRMMQAAGEGPQVIAKRALERVGEVSQEKVA